MNRYSSYSIKPPSIPIPFGKLLKVVASRMADEDKGEQALTERELSDLGIHRSSIARIAHEAAYGK